MRTLPDFWLKWAAMAVVAILVRSARMLLALIRFPYVYAALVWAGLGVRVQT